MSWILFEKEPIDKPEVLKSLPKETKAFVVFGGGQPFMLYAWLIDRDMPFCECGHPIQHERNICERCDCNLFRPRPLKSIKIGRPAVYWVIWTPSEFPILTAVDYIGNEFEDFTMLLKYIEDLLLFKLQHPLPGGHK